VLFAPFCGYINFEEKQREFTHSWQALVKNIARSNPKAILVIEYWDLFVIWCL